MRFRKGIHYPHPPRGRARKRYHMTDEALAQRRRNLRIARERGRLWRGYSESQVIRGLIWQWVCDPQPKPSARTLARKLGVWPSYVRRVARRARSEGADVLGGPRVTWDDLDKARRLTERGREQVPGLFAPALPCRSAAHAEPSIQPGAITNEMRIAQAQLDTLDRLRKRLKQEEERRASAAKWKARIG